MTTTYLVLLAAFAIPAVILGAKLFEGRKNTPETYVSAIQRANNPVDAMIVVARLFDKNITYCVWGTSCVVFHGAPVAVLVSNEDTLG